jgi:nicotinamide mononucleotide (NMN) deamidase PncC
VGLVFIGAARRGAATLVERHAFAGDRSAVRLKAVAAALDLVARRLDA